MCKIAGIHHGLLWRIALVFAESVEILERNAEDLRLLGSRAPHEAPVPGPSPEGSIGTGIRDSTPDLGVTAQGSSYETVGQWLCRTHRVRTGRLRPIG